MVGIMMFGVPPSGGEALEIPPQGGTPNLTTLAKTPAAFAPDSAVFDQRTCTHCAGKAFPSPSASAHDQLLEPIHPRSSAGEMFSRRRVAQEANRPRTESYTAGSVRAVADLLHSKCARAVWESPGCERDARKPERPFRFDENTLVFPKSR